MLQSLRILVKDQGRLVPSQGGILLYDDRIEIESPGLLLPGLTVEDMKQGVSQLRNPVIARVFRELELVEQWGSGIPGIFRQAAAAKLVEPTIEELAGRVRFTVFLPETVPLSREKARGATGVESEMAVEILTKLSGGPLSKAEIARSLGKPKPTRYLNDLMVKLLKEKLVAYTIPEKPNSRLQKYRVTPKGRRATDSS